MDDLSQLLMWYDLLINSQDTEARLSQLLFEYDTKRQVFKKIYFKIISKPISHNNRAI